MHSIFEEGIAPPPPHTHPARKTCSEFTVRVPPENSCTARKLDLMAGSYTRKSSTLFPGLIFDKPRRGKVKNFLNLFVFWFFLLLLPGPSSYRGISCSLVHSGPVRRILVDMSGGTYAAPLIFFL